MKRHKRAALMALVLSAAAVMTISATGKLPPATKLAAPAFFRLATDAAADKARTGPVGVEIHLRRGSLQLGLQSDETFLVATGSYEWDADQPSLTDGEKVIFRSGRTDLAPPGFFQDPLGKLPQYNLLFGRFDLARDLFVLQDGGRSSLNLAGLYITACHLVVNGGDLSAWCGTNSAGCREFSLEVNGGAADLNKLGGLNAAAYRMQVNAGALAAEFGTIKRGERFDLALQVNSGTAGLKLPPGVCLEIELTVKTGLAYLNGRKIERGQHQIVMGSGEPEGSARLTLNAGVLRVTY